jgi:hypothetical protein
MNSYNRFAKVSNDVAMTPFPLLVFPGGVDVSEILVQSVLPAFGARAVGEGNGRIALVLGQVLYKRPDLQVAVVAATVRLIETAHLANLAVVCVEVSLQPPCNGVLLRGGTAASTAGSVNLIADAFGLPAVVAAVVVVRGGHDECGDGDGGCDSGCAGFDAVVWRNRSASVETRLARSAD